MTNDLTTWNEIRAENTAGEPIKNPIPPKTLAKLNKLGYKGPRDANEPELTMPDRITPTATLKKMVFDYFPPEAIGCFTLCYHDPHGEDQAYITLSYRPIAEDSGRTHSRRHQPTHKLTTEFLSGQLGCLKQFETQLEKTGKFLLYNPK